MITIIRVKKLFMIFAVIMITLTGILINITVFKNDKYTYMAVNQRTGTSQARGCITDRNLIPLTGKYERYGENSIARHIIGYIDSDGIGASGIEKSMNDELFSIAEPYGTRLRDAGGNRIPGFSRSHYGNEKYLKLTLDYHIQKIAENVLDSIGKPCGAVILDVENFDVLAMVSRPDYAQNRVADYILQGDTELLNRATSPYNAGSIFKIITAAAALEEDVVAENDVFLCSGSTDIDELRFMCHKYDGHRELDLKTAFSKSCNCVFYSVGQKLGSSVICRYAEIFGIGRCCLNGCIGESRGNLPKDISEAPTEAANLSIGQGDIMITPLQAANIACIIASDGISKEINLIDGIISANGRKIKDMRKYGYRKVISSATASAISEMMREVTETGTGVNAKSEIVSIAGKTGSAETGWYSDGDFMVQGWFIGYFPAEAPKYAMAIMVENGRHGNTACAPIFKEIAEKIVALNIE